MTAVEALRTVGKRGSAGRDAAGLGLASVAGAGLNAAKLVLLAALCSAHELDLMAAGLLVAVTIAQLCGEPLANFAIIRDRARTRRRVGGALPLLFVVAATFPHLVLGAAAPGLQVTPADVESVRLFCLAGAAMVLLWWAAGEAQRNLDFRGVKAVYLAPNASIVVALCLPTGNRTVAVAVGLLVGAGIAAGVVAAGARAGTPHQHTDGRQRAAVAARGGALASLIVLAVATQANLIALRIVASLLPEGSISVVYIATGMVLVPIMAVGASLAASLLPRWAAGSANGPLARPGVAAAASGALTAALVLPLLVGFLVARDVPAVRRSVDPAILSGLDVAIPIVAAGAALHGAAWVARGYAVAHGAIGTITLLAGSGALFVPLAYVLEPTLASVSAGFVLSAVPMLAVIPLARSRGLAVRAPLTAVDRELAVSGAVSERLGRLLAAAQTLGVDATTAEVLGALRGADCRAIVVKGPACQRELYGDGELRTYTDTDLLVAPADLPRAAAVLGSLGFELVLDHREHPGITEPHAQEWKRAPDGAVDLHWRIWGIAAPAERAWEVLAAQARPIDVAGAVGESLDRPSIALLVALHAAHHGRSRRVPLADLDRALERFDAATWAQAARLAAELDATEAFTAGLLLAPAGERLAGELELPAVQSPRRRLMAATQRPGALGVLAVIEAQPGRGRMRAVREGLLPAPAYMRATFPLARRGRTGLALAYCKRVLLRAWQLPAALRAVRSARRAS